jgi:hypothetical protein
MAVLFFERNETMRQNFELAFKKYFTPKISVSCVRINNFKHLKLTPSKILNEFLIFVLRMHVAYMQYGQEQDHQ